jgi:hypothetical protein
VIRGINAGFGSPIAHELPELTRRKMRAIRHGLMPAPAADLHPSEVGVHDRAHTAMLQAELASEPFWTVWPGTRESIADAAAGSDVCVLNEPKQWHWTAEAYAAYVHALWDDATARNLTVWACSLPNLSVADLRWLARVLTLAPQITCVEVHWYPGDRDQEPWKPKPGHHSIARQFGTLLGILDGRRWICGEVGIHTAPLTRGWGPWKRRVNPLTEQNQRDRIKWQLETLERYGCEAAFVYQLQDDPKPELRDVPGGNWGLRRIDGTWKLAADPEQGVFA